MGGVQRLADRAPEIGFQRVTVAAVLVEVGGQGRLDGVGISAQEGMGEPPLFEDAGSEPDELLGTGEGVCSGSSHGPTVERERGRAHARWTCCTLRSGILVACG